MSDLAPRVRRLRSDAVQSQTALIDSAIRVLAVDPDADLARVAAGAGLSRQTLYAHFGSRAGLLAAVAERITVEVARLQDDARLDEGTACDALLRFLRVLDRMPRVWARVAVIATEGEPATDSAELHVPITERLESIVRRGQESGEFTTEVPATWITEATVALGHAAYELEDRGLLTREQASAALRTSLLRMVTRD